MRRINHLVTVDFDRSIGLTADGFSNICYYKIGKLWVGNYGSNSYEASMLVKNVDCNAVDSTAKITIKFTHNQLYMYTNNPINHGSMLANLSDDGTYYNIYYKPSFNFIGKRAEIDILYEFGDINRALFFVNPIQQGANSTAFPFISAQFNPDGEFNTILTNTTSDDIAFAPVFTIAPNTSGDMLLSFSIKYKRRNDNYFISQFYTMAGEDFKLNYATIGSVNGSGIMPITGDTVNTLFTDIDILRLKKIEDFETQTNNKYCIYAMIGTTVMEDDPPTVCFGSIIGNLSSNFGEPTTLETSEMTRFSYQ